MKKIFAFVLALSMLCVMTGCNKSDGGVSDSDSSTGTVENSSQNPSAPDPGSEQSTGSTSKPAADQTGFDFDGAVKNFTLFGNKLSLPCQWSDFCEDFSRTASCKVVGENLSFGLLY